MKIENQTLHQKVVELIKEMIDLGQLNMGEKIDEVSLSESSGVSRTPIREALRILNNQGVVELVPHKGAFVKRFSIKEIEDMFEVIATLESMCAEAAAIKITPKDLEKIERIHKDLERCHKDRDYKEYKKANIRLHAAIQEIAGNAEVNRIISELRERTLLLRRKQLYEGDRFKKSIQEHRSLLNALRKKDHKKAKSVMEKHLFAQAKALIESIQKKKPYWNEIDQIESQPIPIKKEIIGESIPSKH